MSTIQVLAMIVIALPLIILSWHIHKTDGRRPDPYQDIRDRPVIPAVIVDVNMPFSSMTVFMFKLAVASLPAVLLITLVVAGTWAFMLAVIPIHP